jgi:hypothetical protein
VPANAALSKRNPGDPEWNKLSAHAPMQTLPVSAQFPNEVCKQPTVCRHSMPCLDFLASSAGQKGGTRESSAFCLCITRFEQSRVERDIRADSAAGVKHQPDEHRAFASGEIRTVFGIGEDFCRRPRCRHFGAIGTHLAAAHSRNPEIASLMAASGIAPPPWQPGPSGMRMPHTSSSPSGCRHIYHLLAPSVPAGQPGEGSCNTGRQRPMAQHHDDHAGASVMFELVVAATADINPAFSLEPADDLAGFGRRHGYFTRQCVL